MVNAQVNASAARVRAAVSFVEGGGERSNNGYVRPIHRAVMGSVASVCYRSRPVHGLVCVRMCKAVGGPDLASVT